MKDYLVGGTKDLAAISYEASERSTGIARTSNIWIIEAAVAKASTALLAKYGTCGRAQPGAVSLEEMAPRETLTHVLCLASLHRHTASFILFNLV